MDAQTAFDNYVIMLESVAKIAPLDEKPGLLVALEMAKAAQMDIEEDD